MMALKTLSQPGNLFCFQAELHREETKLLVLEVEKLEKQNLEVMSGLFDCRIEDLKISRYDHVTGAPRPHPRNTLCVKLL